MSATADMPTSISTPRRAPMSEAVAHVAPFHDPSREAPPGQGRRLDHRHRGRHLRPRLSRRRCHRLAPGPVGPDQGNSCRLHRRGARVSDRSDALGGAFVLRDPARGLSGPGRVLADRDRLRRRRRDEQLPAREHRHVRDADHVHRDHPGRDLPRRDRGLSRAEDLLHDRGHVRLPLPLPVRARLVQREPRQHLRESGDDDLDPGGRGLFDRHPRPHLLGAGEEALGEGKAGRRRSSPARRSTSSTRSCPRSSPGSASSP